MIPTTSKQPCKMQSARARYQTKQTNPGTFITVSLPTLNYKLLANNVLPETVEPFFVRGTAIAMYLGEDEKR